jgi:glycosyltransferase involved in cell wall biosynthesis
MREPVETMPTNKSQVTRSSKANRAKVIAAIPCYNEEKFISEVVRGANKYVDLVIVIDDGSHDNTSQAAKAAGAFVISHEVNRGAGAATKSCFEAAKTNHADILITIDGDNQHTPEEITGFVAPILRGEADLVIGSRFLGDNSSMPRYRKFGIKVITWLFNIGSKVKISDAQSCYRAHSARLLDAINITESGFGFSVQVLIQARRKKLGIKEVPISCIYHSEGSTINPLSHGLGVAFAVLKLRLKSQW